MTTECLLENALKTIAVMEVRKDGNRWVGDLYFSDGVVWGYWQIAKTLTRLTDNAAATFEGHTIRV